LLHGRGIRYCKACLQVQTTKFIFTGGKQMGMGFRDYPYKVGLCKMCSQGLLTIAKETATTKLRIICDECDDEYHAPDDMIKGKCLHQPTSTGRCEPPSIEEIISMGWDSYILDNLSTK